MNITSLKEYIYENKKIDLILSKIGCSQIKYHPLKEYYSATQADGDNPMGVVISDNKYLNYISYSRNITFEDNKDLIYLVQKTKKKSFPDTCKYVHELLGLDYKIKTKPKKDNAENEVIDPLNVFTKYISHNKEFDINDLKILDEHELDNFVPSLYIGWYKEGIMPYTAKKFGLAYSYRRNRVIIPYRYWLTGEYLGYNSRTTVKNAEELNIKKYWITPTYQKSYNLYGLWENYSAIKKANHVVVVEAEKSVLKRDSLLDSTLVALSGHTMSEEQARILIGLDVEVVIALDKDISIQEVRHMCEMFFNICKISYIYDYFDLMDEKDSPADLKNKYYQFLFNNRITYDLKEHKEYIKQKRNK